VDITALEIISRTRSLLQDEYKLWNQGAVGNDHSFGADRYRWRADDLAIFVDEAQQEICFRYPQACVTTTTVSVTPANYRQSLNTYYAQTSWAQSLVRIEANVIQEDPDWPYPAIDPTAAAAVFNSNSYTLTPPKAWADMVEGAVLVVTVQHYTSGTPTVNPSIPGLTASFTRTATFSAGAISAGTRVVSFKLFKVDAVPSANTLTVNATGTSNYVTRVYYLENVDFEATQNDNPAYTTTTWEEWHTMVRPLMATPFSVSSSTLVSGVPLPLARAAQPRPGDYSFAFAATRGSTSSVVTCDSYPIPGLQPHDSLWEITTANNAALVGFELFGRSINPLIGLFEQAFALEQTQPSTLFGGHFLVRRSGPKYTIGDSIPMVQREAIREFFPESVNNLYDSPTIPTEWYPETNADLGSWFKAWSPAPNDPRGFYLFPTPLWINPNGSRVLATFVVSPAPIRHPDDRLTLERQYWPAMTYWVAYRALTMRKSTFNRPAARRYLQQFEDAVNQIKNTVVPMDNREGRANALPW